MITLIAGTNRKNNVSLQVAKEYSSLLTDQKIENQVFDLSELPNDFIFSALYGEQNTDFNQLLEQKIYKSSAIVIVSPEYNGSYPGVLKAFIDGWDRKQLNEQKVALVGVASGRQGNSRGMDHLTNVLNYLELNVIPFKIPISQVYNIVSKEGEITNIETIDAIKKQITLLV